MTAAAKDSRMFDDIIGRCVAAQTLRAARVITRQYDQALADHGITITQFTLLVAIGRYRPDSLARLAEGLDIERSTLSRNVAKLREGGFVEASTSAGRAHGLSLTRQGLETLQAVYPKWRAVQEAIEAKLGDQTLAQTRSSLKELQQV